MDTDNFLKNLRDTAMSCSNLEYRVLLRFAADEVGGRIAALYRDASESNMKTLNGAWANASRLLANVPPEADPAPLGGDTEPARLAA